MREKGFGEFSPHPMGRGTGWGAFGEFDRFAWQMDFISRS